jgi:hypothetical protein
VQAIDGAFEGSAFAAEQEVSPTGVEAPEGQASPSHFALFPSEPNPFTTTTEIAYRLPSASRVSLVIYDASGRRVSTLLDEVKPAGTHRIVWNGTDARGERVAAGIYHYRMRAGGVVQDRRMVLAR